MLGQCVSLCGEWVVRSAGLTHFRRSSSRVRVLLYIRPPRHRREIAAMGRKGAPAKAHRPRRLPHPPRLRLYFRARVHTSASAFTLPPHGLRRRPRRFRHPAAAVIHNGLSTEKLSTSLLAALCKTFSPLRLRTRIYNISFVRRLLPGVFAPLWGRVRPVVAPWPAPPSAGWGRARAKAGCSPRAVPNNAACVPNHCAQRRKCTRLSPPLPVRSPRVSPPTAEPLPAYGRITVRKGGVHKANRAPARAFFLRQPAYCRAPARLRPNHSA